MEPEADEAVDTASIQLPGELDPATAVVIHTSGSSGTPKAVALGGAALRASAEATHETLGGAGQWLVALPVHRIAGLQMIVRSIVAGTEPLFYEGRFDPAEFLRRVERMEDDRRYTSLVPVQLARLLYYAEQDAGAAQVLRELHGILVGGQSIALALRERAHHLGLEIRRTYGMTETAGGCVYDGEEIGDTRVRIRDGEIQVSGSSLALGYVGDAALTAERFFTEDGTRWYRTGDAGELVGGLLRVRGRFDRVIISGGVNVSL